MPSTRDQLPSTQDARALMRRLDERQPTRATALAYCHGRFQTVRIVDYSRSGLQLQGCFGVAAGDDLIVELLSGDRMAAKVAWSLGKQAGRALSAGARG